MVGFSWLVLLGVGRFSRLGIDGMRTADCGLVECSLNDFCGISEIVSNVGINREKEVGLAMEEGLDGTVDGTESYGSVNRRKDEEDIFE